MRLKMFDAIKVMKINIEEEDYKERYDCEEDDENVEDGRNERFNCDFEGFKRN